MSAAQQAKAKRRIMRNGYAHMGGAMGRPIYKGVNAGRSIADAIAAERAKAAREARARSSKKK